jgi:hypothetical protein
LECQCRAPEPLTVAFTFTIIGILGGVVMLLAILYVPILCAFTGYSRAFELDVGVARWPFLALFYPLWPLKKQRTECGCQPVLEMMSSMLTPDYRRDIWMT